MRRIFGRIRNAVLETLYPEGALCAVCGKISDGEYLCPGCRTELRDSGLLDSWETENLGDVQAWSIRPHSGAARTLVHSLKFRAEARAAEELTSLLRSRPEAFPVFSPETVVTWVPMPAGRRRERCIDHGKLLAEGAARELGLPCRGLLIRRGSGMRQARLGRAGRRRNLKNAYAPAERIAFPVLLVDDVLTTGTTARRCIDALREGGAGEIAVLTMTRAVKQAR